MVDSVFVLHILASFLEYKSQENAPKIIFIAEMVYKHVSTKYIKKKCDFENFLKFRYTLMPPPPSPPYNLFPEKMSQTEGKLSKF